MSFIIENIGTILILAVLAAVVFFIIHNLRKNKKNGKTSCGCGCSNCAMQQHCHGGK